MADETEDTSLDGLEIWRCPQLGGPVTFKYCRVMNAGGPCTRMMSCLGGEGEIVAWLEANYSMEELTALFGGERTGRWDRIVEALNKARGSERQGDS